MIEIRFGDLFSARGAGLICHQVNYKGKMNAGVAKQFKEWYPEVYEEYNEICKTSSHDDLLGTCFFRDNTVCMFAQDNLGTLYTAFHKCCNEIAQYVESREDFPTIHMPYGIGSGLGGAKWDDILDILLLVFNDYHVVLWKI